MLLTNIPIAALAYNANRIQLLNNASKCLTIIKSKQYRKKDERKAEVLMIRFCSACPKVCSRYSTSSMCLKNRNSNYFAWQQVYKICGAFLKLSKLRYLKMANSFGLLHNKAKLVCHPHTSQLQTTNVWTS